MSGAALILSAVAVIALGCAPVAPPSPPSPSVGGSPTIVPTPAAAPTPAPSGAEVIVDGSLLDALPAEIAGSPRMADVETAAGIATDPALAADIDALAVGLYAGQADYAVVTVTRLRPGVISDSYVRDWRDTFDAGVCAQAGGIDGHAEASIGGRTTFIGTCLGGVRTYHVRLADPDRIVSLQALGDARYGELIVAGLTE